MTQTAQFPTAIPTYPAIPGTDVFADKSAAEIIAIATAVGIGPKYGSNITVTGSVAIGGGKVYLIATVAAPIALTLATTGATLGDTMTFVRTDTSAFAVGIGSLYTMPASKACIVTVRFNGTAWVLDGPAMSGTDIQGVDLVYKQGPTISFVGNAVTVTAGSGIEYDVPTTGGASVITLADPTAVGQRLRFRADGTKNGHTVQYKQANGAAALTTALTASKRHFCEFVSDGTVWVGSAYVSP